MNRRVVLISIGVIGLIAVVAIGWYLASPLIIDQTVDEAHPLEIPDTIDTEEVSDEEMKAPESEFMAAVPSPTMTPATTIVPAVATATSPPAQTPTPTATMVEITSSATADASQAAGGTTVPVTPPPPTPPPWTATPVQPEPTAECPAAWFMDGPPDECPVDAGLTSFAASQRFERGRMIWIEETDTFYIFFNLGAHPFDNRLVFQTLGPLVLVPGASADNRVEESPPWPGLLEPVSGFGLLWRGEVEGLDVDLRQALGWAVEKEFGFETKVQCQRQETYSARTCYLQDTDGSAIVLAYHAIAGNLYWRWVGIDE